MALKLNSPTLSVHNKFTLKLYDTDGKLLKQENIIDYTKSNILGYSSSLEQFIKISNKLNEE